MTGPGTTPARLEAHGAVVALTEPGKGRGDGGWGCCDRRRSRRLPRGDLLGLPPDHIDRLARPVHRTRWGWQRRARTDAIHFIAFLEETDTACHPTWRST